MRYKVELSALAAVSQIQYVEASSKEEAERLAKAKSCDHQWQYGGVNDDTIDIVSAEPSALRTF